MAKSGKGAGRGDGSPIRRDDAAKAPKVSGGGWVIRNAASGAIIHASKQAAVHAGGGPAVPAVVADTRGAKPSTTSAERIVRGAGLVHYGGGGKLPGGRKMAGTGEIVVIEGKRINRTMTALEALADAEAAQADAVHAIVGAHRSEPRPHQETMVASIAARAAPAATKADLVAAARAATEAGDEDIALRRAALAVLGLDAAGAPTEEALIETIAAGFPAAAIDALRAAGWPYEVMQEVIAPRRTLMRRRSAGQTLTPSESDAAWRLATVLVAAERVFASRDAALAWLLRTKLTLRGRSPAELVASSVGTAHILSVLRRVDAGDYL